jgi:hypothetical protein
MTFAEVVSIACKTFDIRIERLPGILCANIHFLQVSSFQGNTSRTVLPNSSLSSQHQTYHSPPQTPKRKEKIASIPSTPTTPVTTLPMTASATEVEASDLLILNCREALEKLKEKIIVDIISIFEQDWLDAQKTKIFFAQAYAIYCKLIARKETVEECAKLWQQFTELVYCALSKEADKVNLEAVEKGQDTTFAILSYFDRRTDIEIGETQSVSSENTILQIFSDSVKVSSPFIPLNYLEQQLETDTYSLLMGRAYINYCIRGRRRILRRKKAKVQVLVDRESMKEDRKKFKKFLKLETSQLRPSKVVFTPSREKNIGSPQKLFEEPTSFDPSEIVGSQRLLNIATENALLIQLKKLLKIYELTDEIINSIIKILITSQNPCLWVFNFLRWAFHKVQQTIINFSPIDNEESFFFIEVDQAYDKNKSVKKRLILQLALIVDQVQNKLLNPTEPIKNRQEFYTISVTCEIDLLKMKLVSLDYQVSTENPNLKEKLIDIKNLLRQDLPQLINSERQKEYFKYLSAMHLFHYHPTLNDYTFLENIFDGTIYEKEHSPTPNEVIMLLMGEYTNRQSQQQSCLEYCMRNGIKDIPRNLAINGRKIKFARKYDGKGIEEYLACEQEMLPILKAISFPIESGYQYLLYCLMVQGLFHIGEIYFIKLLETISQHVYQRFYGVKFNKNNRDLPTPIFSIGNRLGLFDLQQATNDSATFNLVKVVDGFEVLSGWTVHEVTVNISEYEPIKIKAAKLKSPFISWKTKVFIPTDSSKPLQFFPPEFIFDYYEFLCQAKQIQIEELHFDMLQMVAYYIAEAVDDVMETGKLEKVEGDTVFSIENGLEKIRAKQFITIVMPDNVCDDYRNICPDDVFAALTLPYPSSIGSHPEYETIYHYCRAKVIPDAWRSLSINKIPCHKLLNSIDALPDELTKIFRQQLSSENIILKSLQAFCVQNWFNCGEILFYRFQATLERDLYVNKYLYKEARYPEIMNYTVADFDKFKTRNNLPHSYIIFSGIKGGFLNDKYFDIQTVGGYIEFRTYIKITEINIARGVELENLKAAPGEFFIEWFTVTRIHTKNIFQPFVIIPPRVTINEKIINHAMINYTNESKIIINTVEQYAKNGGLIKIPFEGADILAEIKKLKNPTIKFFPPPKFIYS